MEPIIAPVDKELIKAELTPDRFMRDTRKGGNKIYIIDCNNAPNVMREIGRLREIAFRYPGGGTGLPLDIDEFDTMDPPCQQLIVWNPDAEEIIGGYRFIVGENIRNDEMGRPRIATSHLFEFSQMCIRDRSSTFTYNTCGSDFSGNSSQTTTTAPCAIAWPIKS